MKQIKYENNTISHRKSEIKSIINDFRNLLKFMSLNITKKGCTP